MNLVYRKSRMSLKVKFSVLINCRLTMLRSIYHLTNKKVKIFISHIFPVVPITFRRLKKSIWIWSAGNVVEVMVPSLPKMLLSCELCADYFETFSFTFYSPRYFQSCFNCHENIFKCMYSWHEDYGSCYETSLTSIQCLRKFAIKINKPNNLNYLETLNFNN